MVWYYYICTRQVWLIAHSIEPDQENNFLKLGRHIHEIFYKRNKKEFFIDNQIKIDIIYPKKVIGEIKKSSKYNLKSAQMQLAFYLYYMKQKGVELEGELHFPEERKKEIIKLTPEVEKELENAITNIKKIIQFDIPPEPIKIPFCTNCAYKDMCWS